MKVKKLDEIKGSEFFSFFLNGTTIKVISLKRQVKLKKTKHILNFFFII